MFNVSPALTHVQLYFKLGRKTKYLQTKYLYNVFYIYLYRFILLSCILHFTLKDSHQYFLQGRSIGDEFFQSLSRNAFLKKKIAYFLAASGFSCVISDLCCSKWASVQLWYIGSVVAAHGLQSAWTLQFVTRGLSS